jgi:N-acetylmuramoyl-L-alanine amidase
MHRSAFLFSLAFLCLIILIPSFVLGKNSKDDRKISIDKQYTAAKTSIRQLETDPTAVSSQKNWMKCAKNFRTVYLADPQSKYAPNCLFILGKIHQRMFSRFKDPKDLAEAIASYNDVSSLFPENSLADDALFAVANIYLDNMHDPKKSAEFFKKIVTEYPNGDMLSKASDELKALTKEPEELSPPPLPLVDNSQTTKRVHVLPVKYWSSNDYTRIVIDTSGPVTFKEQLLEQVGDQPRRLYIDFFNSYVDPKFRTPVPIEDGLLKRVRTGQYNIDTVRVVLDIESISSYKVFSLPDPFRVVADVRGQNKDEPALPEVKQPVQEIEPIKTPNKTPPEAPVEATASKSASEDVPLLKALAKTPPKVPSEVKNEGPSKIIVLRDSKKTLAASSLNLKESNPKASASTTSGKTFSLAQQLGLRIKKIVLDPGHGGKDPGAMSFNLKEKDIVLKVAMKLAPLLEKKLGCKVILTRKRDVFIPLEERTAIANTNDADLFISLHINSSSTIAANGIETYFLNLTTNPEAMRVAAFENATSTHQMSDLQNILSDILKTSKVSESSRLAQQVHNSMITGLEKKYPHIKNLGVKQAPFYVLIGAEMPAILVEMSFISNPDDAEHLKNNHFLNSIANDISSGIQSYISHNTASL